MPPKNINKIRIDSKSDGFIDKLIDSYAPHIFGMKDVKLACLLQLAGGTEGVKRPNINILLVGDPSMAKSVLLVEADKITQSQCIPLAGELLLLG